MSELSVITVRVQEVGGNFSIRIAFLLSAVNLIKQRANGRQFISNYNSRLLSLAAQNGNLNARDDEGES